jgi:hypothetical protein
MTQQVMDRQAAEEQAAQDYADFIILGRYTAVAWGAVNAHIVERWSMTALRRIKKRAWAIVAEREAGRG